MGDSTNHKIFDTDLYNTSNLEILITRKHDFNS